MFEILNKQPVKLINYNPRAEKHGKEHKPAATLRVQAAMKATALSMFAPGLTEALYKPGEDQADLATPEKNDLTARRFSKMSPFKWAFEGKGYETTIDYGLGGESDIVLDDCNVKGFVIQPMENGIVLIDFSINCSPNERDSGILDHRIQQEITITLKAPAPQTVGELFGDDPQAKPEPATAEES